MKRAKLLEMEEYIRFRQTISLKELQDHFDVSINTVRRYIATILESNPDIKKVYGGVTVETGAVPRGNAVFHPYFRGAGDSECQREAAALPLRGLQDPGPRHHLY